jgi:non-ribosomal peptide synthetase component E (peptide arylation enzyme)
MSESDGFFTNGDVMKFSEKGMIIVDICVQVKNENVCFCL